MNRWLATSIVMASAPILAQGVPYQGRVMVAQRGYNFGQQAPLMAVGGAIVTVCATPTGTGINPCGVYTDIALTIPQVGPITADADGAWSMFGAPGNYMVSVKDPSGLRQIGKTFTISLAGNSTSAVLSVNSMTGPVVLTPLSIGADPAGAASAVGATALAKTSNLADLPSPSTARANLGAQQVLTLTSTGTGAASLSGGALNIPVGSGLPDPGANGLVTRTGTNASGTFGLPVGGATAQLSPLAVLPSADNAQTAAGGNGIANLAAGACASGTAQFGCSFQMSPTYPLADYSYFFNTQQNRDSWRLQQFPYQGGIGRTRFAEDNRQGNKFWTFINPLPPYTQGQYDNRSAFVAEFRSSGRVGYADSNGGMQLRQIIAGSGYNYFTAAATEKNNNFLLWLEGHVHSASQGGGMLQSTLNKSGPGDDMVFTVQHDTMGCNEGEDECDKLFRAFLETSAFRWGGTLNAVPTVDPGGIGLYTFRITQGAGYDLAWAGETLPLVNLSNSYTTGNIATVTTSSAYPALAKITGDAASAWATQFGASAMATLTAPIDNQTYDGNCPSTVTNSAARYPDPTITNESGVGGLMGYCATFNTTAGIVAGKPLRIAGPKGNYEDVLVTTVVDGTHLKLNARRYHDVGEVAGQGGAAGYAIRKTDDDIPINGLTGYVLPQFQNATVLHKYWPIVGSDSSGALYVYINTVRSLDMQSKGYAYNVPNAAATVAATLTGTAVTALTVTNGGTADYRTQQAGIEPGSQVVLAPPALTFSGCTTPPTYTATMTQIPGYHQVPVYTVTGGGNCASTPTVAVQATYAIPYSINPMAITEKVVDPTNGKLENAGYALTGPIDPTLFPAGATVEMEAWMKDATRSTQNFAQYLSPMTAGPVLQHFFNGAWGRTIPTSFMGVLNNTDGHRYYQSVSQPIGPGIADLLPLDGYSAYGDMYNGLYLSSAPLNAAIYVDQCSQTPYHPCKDGIVTAYDIFHAKLLSGVDVGLRFDPTTSPYVPFQVPTTGTPTNVLSWGADFAAQTLRANNAYVNTLNVLSRFNTPLFTPASSSATCTAGDWAHDANFEYDCVATNTWKRVALSAF